MRDYGTAAARAAMEIALFKGAGKLIEGKSLLLTGEKAGRKGTGTGKAPYTSTVSTDVEAGMPYAHPVKEAGAKELERIEPPIPKVDVTNDFMMRVVKDGGVELKYGNPDGVAGLVVNVNKEGVLGFDIRAAQNHPLYDASGTDMFASAMQRLGNEGIQVNQIRGAWVAGTDSVNTAQYLENIANGMSKENAALKTWTGQISQKYGYGKVDKIETIGDITYVTFKK